MKKENQERETVRVLLTLDVRADKYWSDIAKLCGKPKATFITEHLEALGDEMDKFKMVIFEYLNCRRSMFTKILSGQVESGTLINDSVMKPVQEARKAMMSFPAMVEAGNSRRAKMFEDIKAVRKEQLEFQIQEEYGREELKVFSSFVDPEPPLLADNKASGNQESSL